MTGPPAGKKVVVCDDDSSLIELLQYLLRLQGHAVLATEDGQETVRLVSEFKPDLVILDLHIPKKDGFAILEELKADPEMKKIKTLVVSATQNKQEIKRVKALGADDFVVKPFNCDDLVAKVEALLRNGSSKEPADTPDLSVLSEPKADFDPSHAGLGPILVQLGLISEEQLKEAQAKSNPDQRNLSEVVVSMGMVSEEAMLKGLSMRQHVPYFESFEGLLDPEAAKLLPETLAREFLAAPIRKLNKGLLLGMVNTLDIVAMDNAAAASGLRILPVLTTRANLFKTIDFLYAPKAAAPAKPNSAPAASAAEISVIDTVNEMLAAAIDGGASDIHLEPAEESVVVRFRVDGLLRDRERLPKDVHSALVARIKILSRLDITETRLPQDGHIRHMHKGRGVDLRISTLSSLFGEKVVVRILDHSKGIRRLSELGMPPAIVSSFQTLLARPTGLILVTGPTGSGKTTTLYAALNEINTREKNIVTLEDPIEYHLDGITQTETLPRAGLTFATGLRAILRQDPNVILVGEIRDLETAEIAVQAAVTGHLVLSTLHTKDAIGTATRLLNMKIQPFLLASALSGVLAQRLVRVLCDQCKKETPPRPEELKLLGAAPPKGSRFYAPVGCPACRGTGYLGRLAIYEWLEVTEEVRAWIFSGRPADELRRSLKSRGGQSLQEDGLQKAAQGITSLAEVIRVTHEEKA
jgi:type IV pilus assembly protein PilB